MRRAGGYVSEIQKSVRRHWLEYTSTAAVLAISLLSLWVAIGTEDANEKMVEASSWPLLQVATGNVDENGNHAISFEVTNSGAGTAKLESFEFFWNGKAFANSMSYMEACCGFPPFHPNPESHAPPGLSKESQRLMGRAVRAGEEIKFLKVPLLAPSAAAWNRLDQARFSTTYRACYCSVFDQCWTSNLRDLHPVRVDRCEAPKVPYIE
jgi:hypothetical protein